jgi:hypothetical protein
MPRKAAATALREVTPEGEGARFVIQRPQFRHIVVRLEGLSPLVVHRWSEKAMGLMAAKQAGAPKTRKRETRDPEAEFKAASYVLDDGSHGFPAGAFKLAAVSSCRLIDGITMTAARGLFVCPQEYVTLTNPAPEKGRPWPAIDTRPVRVGMGAADIRYRPLYWPWACELGVRFVAGATSTEQIGYLLMLAGEAVGVGEMRPEKGGNYGRFRIAD